MNDMSGQEVHPELRCSSGSARVLVPCERWRGLTCIGGKKVIVVPGVS